MLRRFLTVRAVVPAAASANSLRVFSSYASSSLIRSSNSVFNSCSRSQHQSLFAAAFLRQSLRHSSSDSREQQEAEEQNNNDEEEDEDFSFDTSAAIAQDARKMTQGERIEAIVNELLPPSSRPPQEAVLKVTDYFTKEPINDCILADRVVITHVQNEEGEDSKLKMPEMSFEDALEQAKENSRDLVQVAFNQKSGVAYCRLRDAKGKALEMVKPLLEAAEVAAQMAGAGAGGGDAAAGAGGGYRRPQKEREMKTHTFRDVADTHFCNWRGKKVVGELQRGHPIKLQILQFISPQTAAAKMQEMLQSIAEHAEKDEAFDEGIKKEKRPAVGHQSTGIHVSERELAVTLKATEAGGPVKHPSSGDWKAAVKRHEALCKRAQGDSRRSLGTVAESKALKRKTGGISAERQDRYGRKL